MLDNDKMIHAEPAQMSDDDLTECLLAMLDALGLVTDNQCGGDGAQQ